MTTTRIVTFHGGPFDGVALDESLVGPIPFACWLRLGTAERWALYSCRPGFWKVYRFAGWRPYGAKQLRQRKFYRSAWQHAADEALSTGFVLTKVEAA